LAGSETTLLLVVLALAAVGWFWYDSLRAREHAITASLRLCRDMDLQFLDETVGLVGLRLRRDPAGTVRWQRVYGFEFCLPDGRQRFPGRVVMLGPWVERLWLDHPAGEVIVPSRGPRA
jgi:hypothetical protein